MQEEIMMFDVINDAGEKTKCEVLFTFELDETNKKYMVYTDNSLDNEGNIKTYVGTYKELTENTRLEPITSAEEIKMVEEVLKQYQESLD